VSDSSRRKEQQEQIRAALQPVIKIVGVLILIAIAAAGTIVLYFLRLAGGVWGGQ
jgi:hypothetical protein